MRLFSLIQSEQQTPQASAHYLINAVSEFDHQILSAHFHDTRAMALANVCAALS